MMGVYVPVNTDQRGAIGYIIQEDGCWGWTGSPNGNGYGHARVDGKTYVAHRYVYQSTVGPIPEGLQLDHLCRNRMCVNPSHLEPVTHRENVLRGQGHAAINARKTHCSCGLPLEFRYGQRLCYPCLLAYCKERKRARRRSLGVPEKKKAVA